jgi:hypothetical protein
MQGANESSPHVDSHIVEHVVNCSPGGHCPVTGASHFASTMGGQKPVQPTEQKGASFVDQEPNMQSYFDALHSSHEEMAAQPSWRSFSLARRAHTALASVALEATYMEMSAMGQFSSQEPDSPVIMQPLVRQRWQSFPYEAQVSVTLGHCSRGMHRPVTSRE